MKRLAILGSTGSIGVNALDVARRMPGRVRVVGLAARSNVALLSSQARRFKPRCVAMFEPEAARALKTRLDGTARHLPSGVEGLVALASQPDCDVVLTSLVGGVGFAPLLAAIKSGKTVALANKEPMVMAGAQFVEEARRWQARLVPVDSEPSAIFQCVQGAPEKSIKRVILTASGGSFYKRKGSLRDVSVREALRHPTWKMGRKITIDCATLMNKGLETIEIMNLFALKLEQVEVVIHPQSVIHSAVEFSDGSVLAQLSPPDMRLPIQYAMTYPERAERLIAPLDLFSIQELTFRRPDFRRFPCLALARQAARMGRGMPCVLNAADEVAVQAFLSEAIRFTDIARVVESTLKAYRPGRSEPSLAEIVEIDQWARQKAEEFCRP
ncbi:MAG: 1-deoxy-D-xylulose-5-phosphate reductoisomerase [Elusimicrobia bacterium]|nr:1-deoxy-D-xylulose-5-phosphate reductoisomerase [Elusimicrobiota bacterium]MDE2425478.1 1-deoxy-D-xylulose-5-phosphate reductoisomerase [Elusimicrobiota bacterium]